VVGDLVLKWKTSQDGVHKLATPWEGPYIVKAVTRMFGLFDLCAYGIMS
jgi:hypothetical protein